MTTGSSSGIKPRAVVFGLTANHIAAVATVMMDLRRLSPGLADVCVIIHDGRLSTGDQKLLASIMPCRFEAYRFPISDLSVFTDSTIKRFSHMVFSKFECLRLLDDYRAVMWLDYDIVVQADISDLMEPGRHGARFMPGGARVRDQLHADVVLRHPIPEYDLDAPGICGSTFVLFDTLATHGALHTFCYETLVRYAKHLHLGEQAVFDFLIQHHGLAYDPIDPLMHTPHPTDTAHARTARIIHAFGSLKFWNGLANAQWQANYAAWRKLGGSPIPGDPLWKRLRRALSGWFR